MKGALRRARRSLVGVPPLLLACTSLLVLACATLPRSLADGVVNRWDAESAAAGRRLIAEYGVPDDVTLNRLTWYHRGVWDRTTASNAAGFWRRTPAYRTPENRAVVEQSIRYPLSAGQTADLLAFSPGLSIDRARGELSSRAPVESLNFLALNLADEVARGRTSVSEARADYDRIIELSAAGKSSPYTEGLLFPVAEQEALP